MINSWKIVVGKSEGKGSIGDLRVDDRIILIRILKNGVGLLRRGLNTYGSG
jgi:hypothetical protein